MRESAMVLVLAAAFVVGTGIAEDARLSSLRISPQESPSSDPVGFTTSGGGAVNELYRFRPTEWDVAVHIDPMCLASPINTATASPNDEWAVGPNDEWYIVYGEGTHGGNLTGYTPAGFIRDSLDVAIPWASDKCAWEQRYLAGPGGGGSLGPRMDLVNGNGAGASAVVLKAFFVWVTFLEASGVAGGVNDWVYRQTGTKFFRPMCTAGSTCPGPGNGWGILDFVDGSTAMYQMGTDEFGCPHLPANVWARYPSHVGDTIGPNNGGACRFRADEQLDIGVAEVTWVCVDADPDHDLDPTGDGQIVSWGKGQAEGMMGWHYVNNGSVDVAGLWRGFLDSTWGGSGTKPYDFSRYTLHFEVWTGDGTGTSQSCVDPPPAP